MDAKLLSIIDNQEEKYPHALAQMYPRIVNKITALWDSPSMKAYFADLLIDDRGNRKGFPKEVLAGIHFLWNVFQKKLGRDKNPWRHDPETIKQELQRMNINFTPQGFIKSCEEGNERAVTLFLNGGMSVDICDSWKWTPLMFAALKGHQTIVIMLLKHFANINARNNQGYAALHWAAYNGHVKIAELLLSNGADVNVRSLHGWTPLLQASSKGHLSITSLLLEKGAEVNMPANDGLTPLHKAAANGNLPEVILLLNKGANIQAKYCDGSTALDLAKQGRHQPIVDRLLVNMN